MIDFHDLSLALHQWRSQQGLVSAAPNSPTPPASVTSPATVRAAGSAAPPAQAPAIQAAPPRRPAPQSVPPPPPMMYEAGEDIEELQDEASDYSMSFGEQGPMQTTPPHDAFGTPARTMQGQVPPTANAYPVNRDETFGDDGATVVGGPRGRDEE